jgi:hypothetical protein
MLGEVSSVLVPRGTYVRIPDTIRSTEAQDCFMGCHCDSSSKIEHCRALECLHRKACMLGSGNKQGTYQETCKLRTLLGQAMHDPYSEVSSFQGAI